jgi:hypothetical protein
MPALRTRCLILASVTALSAVAVLMQELVNARLRAEAGNLKAAIAQTSTKLEKARADLAESKASLAIEDRLIQIEAQPPTDFPKSKDYKKLEVRLQGDLANNYAVLFRRLKLSPDNLALFEKLIVQKEVYETAIAHYLSAGVFQGLDRNDLDALKTLTAAGTEDVDQQIRQLLGDTAYQQYDHYSSTLNSRQQVNAFADQLRYSNVQLSDTQADQLVDVLAGADSDPTLPLPDSFQVKVAAVLGPGQSQALKTLMATLQARRTIQAMNQAALAKGIVPPNSLTGADLLFNLQK